MNEEAIRRELSAKLLLESKNVREANSDYSLALVFASSLVMDAVKNMERHIENQD
jgi:hypothetical protein